MEDPAASQTQEKYPRWAVLEWFAFYRLCLAAGLVFAYLSPFANDWLVNADKSLSVAISFTYLLLVLLSLLLTRLRKLGKTWLVQTSVFIDILTFTLLMHGNGGVESGYSLILAIVVAAGALLLEGRQSLLFAAIATLSVLAEQTYTTLSLSQASGSYTRTGLLGLTYFTVALLAHVLYRRIQETEHLAARRLVDIADLSKLNEFIIQQINTGILVLDERRHIQMLNRAAAQLLGIPSDTKHHPHLRTLSPALWDWIERHLRVGEPTSPNTVEIQNREIEPSFLPIGDCPTCALVVFLRDKQALIQEAQQIKLASLGRLTASIAHNIRNPLSAITHAGQLLLESPVLELEEQQLLQIIVRNTKRIDEIIESVLQLSQRNQPEIQRIALQTWLQEFAEEFLELDNLPRERWKLSIEENLPEVAVDPRHLRQILFNLCDNVVQHGGDTAQLHLRAALAQDQQSVLLQVRDTGPQIEPAIAKEIFNPFFTTSVTGTGLGLYIALELSEANGIRLSYLPLEPQGNCFQLVLPTL